LDDPLYRRLVTPARRENRPLSNFIQTATLRFIDEQLDVDEYERREIQGNRSLNRKIRRGHREAALRRGRFV
jgi:hypothetical protein